ncbi:MULTISPECIES: glycoside hydrolase family 16 protein [Sinorhizobium/Ensifer group]|uniref:Beta-glucanase n=2 Tax=Sinorhizobium TaxID=28105 RepID=A0A249PPK6_9HYPH|nr:MULTISPECIES: glycoside hydrolase family 16 protein [Sinorhizobium]MCK3781303.1 glycoside hydrolase family 16 protein [Ensifer sesbaniae]ASY67219.1 Beta-glucanase precursor [Sinorhizobium sojae CCBAU 05684]AWM29845.1 Beta-glucanase precursor [Sinorhizobium fredii CCBAU 25509]MQW94215.1 family 16 glycosylhydrolase [Sinorhizobium fredii]UTY47641.1 glycoside hydrolase family 16 protein [Sinorhizobium fredii]
MRTVIYRQYNLLCFAFFVFAAPTAGAQEAKIPEGYRLVWSDEFDRAGLPDPAKWVYDTEGNKSGWYNNEKQYYAVKRRKNGRGKDGKLIITARKERLTSASDYGGQNYTSARLITRGKAAWVYGHFAIRARLPCGRGTWPAFWMLGADKTPWPENGEIDIMEQVGSAPDKIKGTIHTKATARTFGIGGETVLSDACRRFHIYTLTWTPTAISIGVNGHSYFTYKNPQEGSSSWPFDTPHFLLLNLAIGGDMAGKIDDAIFPVSMDIDYVRVYQKVN